MMQFGRGIMSFGGATAFTPGLLVRSHEASSFRLQIRIANDAHIRRAWGAATAELVVAELRQRLVDALPGGSRVQGEGGGVLVVDLHSDGLPDDRVIEAMLPLWLGDLCAATLLDPIETGVGAIGVWLSAQWSVDGQSRGAICPFHGAPLAEGREAEAAYRADMARVVAFLPLLAGGNDRGGPGFVLHWQPVVNLSGGVLFHEALCRPWGDDGAVEAPEPLLLALERLGFVCLLDRAVVSTVIDELDRAPDVVLAVNVSAQSLSCTASWSGICDRLSRRPDLGKRLVWEITETALASDMAQATAFIAAIKALGCRVAVDDFGVGFASIRQLLVFSPDIIKIDRLFLEQAMTGGRDAVIFRQMVELARSFGAEVVAEGIETLAHAELVAAAGGVWQQGYFHARPSLTRLWGEGPSLVSEHRAVCP